jgi:hypothetical protein
MGSDRLLKDRPPEGPSTSKVQGDNPLTTAAIYPTSDGLLLELDAPSRTDTVMHGMLDFSEVGHDISHLEQPGRCGATGEHNRHGLLLAPNQLLYDPLIDDSPIEKRIDVVQNEKATLGIRHQLAGPLQSDVHRRNGVIKLVEIRLLGRLRPDGYHSDPASEFLHAPYFAQARSKRAREVDERCPPSMTQHSAS